MKDIQDQFEISPLPQNAALVREKVRKTAINLGFSHLDIDDIVVAVGEAVTNAILYGSPKETSKIQIIIWFCAASNELHIEIYDQGIGFNPDIIRNEADNDALGGRGIRLMRALMDSVVLNYDGNGMSVSLSKRIHQPC